ncbi:ATP-binding protein [Halovivax gelatinilyticus]|uniref:ATP-binding protein n=1 Tax=Halovivax gelatinilyticus TaxID=2961597 RepID=UPI0020CA6747|nr:ATP-binding protein [Halovivax gelatinilyticus]
MSEFVNRDDDLAQLRSLYRSDSATLAVMWGRRRVGKTRLLTESIRNREDAVYYQATETTATDQLTEFRKTAARQFPEVSHVERAWEPLLRSLTDRDAIIVLDEFPYLADADSSLPSIIQRLWDHDVKGSAATLVLSGSSIGMMYELTLDGTAPLYGRISQQPSGKFPIEPLDFADAVRFVPSYDSTTQVVAYAIFGGVPHYLQAIDESETVGENVTRTLLDQRGSLHEEPELLLRMEFDEVSRYFAILKAIAAGNRTRNEIATAVGIDANSSSYYLDRLEDLALLEPVTPVTADPVRSRNRRYRICDRLFTFWFRFVYGQDGRFELYGEDAYAELVEPELADYVSPVFESLCRKAVPSLYGDLTFATLPGRWWYKHHEIDVVGLTTGDTLVAGEVKYTSQPVGYDVLARLKEEVRRIDWTPSGGGEPTYEFALFSRNGFTQSVVEAAEKDDRLRLFSLDDVVSSLNAPSSSAHD